MSPMSMSEVLLAEFDVEGASTRRMLERVPTSSFDWSPHPKSMTLARLSTHIADLPRWASLIVGQDSYDLATGNPIEPAGSTTELLERFDFFRSDFEGRLAGRGDAELLAPWSLRHGEKVIVEIRQASALRAFVLSHTVHHRGQLSVYLRLLDVPLPQTYGPSADDRGDFGD